MIAVPICIYFIIQYRKKSKSNQINRQVQIEEQQPLDTKLNQLVTVNQDDLFKKKPVKREISSVSENLGSLIEKKNNIYKEKLEHSNESQGFIPKLDE